MYNVLLYPDEQYATMVQIAKYATEAGLAQMLAPVVKVRLFSIATYRCDGVAYF